MKCAAKSKQSKNSQSVFLLDTLKSRNKDNPKYIRIKTLETKTIVLKKTCLHALLLGDAMWRYVLGRLSCDKHATAPAQQYEKLLLATAPAPDYRLREASARTPQL